MSVVHWNGCVAGVRRHVGGGRRDRLGLKTSQTSCNQERSGACCELGRSRTGLATPDTDHYKQLQESDGV